MCFSSLYEWISVPADLELGGSYSKMRDQLRLRLLAVGLRIGSSRSLLKHAALKSKTVVDPVTHLKNVKVGVGVACRGHYTGDATMPGYGSYKNSCVQILHMKIQWKLSKIVLLLTGSVPNLSRCLPCAIPFPWSRARSVSWDNSTSPNGDEARKAGQVASAQSEWILHRRVHLGEIRTYCEYSARPTRWLRRLSLADKRDGNGDGSLRRCAWPSHSPRRAILVHYVLGVT